MKFTLEDLKRSKVAHLNPLVIDSPKKKHKYNCHAIEIDGHKFPSKKEAGRYLILQRDKTLGLIKDLRLQVKYQLNQEGSFSYTYIADFVYTDVATGREIVEDAKGYRTREYRKKAKLMKELHGIEVREV